MRYRKNRDLLATALRRAGVSNLAPAEGAFYLYADFSRFTRNSTEFCRRMLDDIHVAATSGLDFDPEDGNRYVRFSYCGDERVIAQAAERIERYLQAAL